MFKSSLQESGYSLFELLVVCMLFALLSKSAVASFPLLQQGVHRNSVRQELESDIRRARADALAKGARVILEISAGGNSYTIGTDEYPYSSDLTADEITYTRELPSGYTMTSTDIIAFSSNGYLIDEYGDLVDASVSVLEDGESFLTANIYPTGGLDYES